MDVVTTVDELKAAIGRVVTISEWVLVDQDRINAFAEVGGDHQWIHVDPERAKDTPFGGTIAHGMLTASMASGMPVAETLIEIKIPQKMGIHYGFNKIRFIAPVKVGSRVRTVSAIMEVEDLGDKVLQVTRKVTVEIEGAAKPAMVAESVARLILE
jgi:acyl dehydratase